MRRVMIAGTSSGCGKTTIVCAILQALVDRGKRVASFKCGPDYIDPLFHSRVIGTKARNLDGYFMDRDTLNDLLEWNSRGMDMSVIEGGMGYYDGLGMEDTASSYGVARDTGTPVVLIVPCQGMSRSVQALLGGYLDFVKDSGIAGVIFNQLSQSLYSVMKDFCTERGIKALGYFPRVEEAVFSSRHLGLIPAEEVAGWKEKLQCLAKTAEQYLDMDGLLELASTATERKGKTQGLGDFWATYPKEIFRVGVARDRAFCFYYEDNLELLRQLGCELVEFSPLQDVKLPEDIHGLILGGGYPEVFGRELEQNESMRRDIQQRIKGGLPTYAECGGYLYLHRQIIDEQGHTWRMAGVLDGEAFFTDRLQHFGYVTLTAREDTLLCGKGDIIRAHEFHRCYSTVSQEVFCTEKHGQSWGSFVSCYHLLAGFPHIHYYANPDFAVHFYQQCLEYRETAGRTDSER